MKCLIHWFNNLSNRARTSFTLSFSFIGLLSTVLSIVGFSLNDITQRIWLSIIIVITGFFLVSLLVFFLIGQFYKDSVSCTVRQTSVTIETGDIFKTTGWKVIGCDSHFDTRIDDNVISKKSLHGQLFLHHGNIEAIKNAVRKEARRLRIKVNQDGFYDFPLGTIIRYDNPVDNETYLLLAMTKLNCNYEAHTNMAEFEQMLMHMWAEISRVYAGNIIVLPMLGTGISRFDDGPKDKRDLLRCMLCTLNGSGASIKSEIKIVIYGDAKDYALFEYRNMFKSLG